MLLTAKDARQKAKESIITKVERDLMRAEVVIAEAVEIGLHCATIYGYNLCSEAEQRLEELGYRIETFYEDGFMGTRISW